MLFSFSSAYLLLELWRNRLFVIIFVVILLLLQVFDELGRDVTPRPLYHPEPSAAIHRQSKILSAQDFAGVTQNEFLSSFSAQQMSGASISLAGPFSRYGMAVDETLLDKLYELATGWPCTEYSEALEVGFGGYCFMFPVYLIVSTNKKPNV